MSCFAGLHSYRKATAYNLEGIVNFFASGRAGKPVSIGEVLHFAAIISGGDAPVTINDTKTKGSF